MRRKEPRPRGSDELPSRKIRDLRGQKFGRLEVLKFSHLDRKPYAHWLCRCECGTEKVIAGYLIKCGNTQSCGCLHREILATSNKSHGSSRDPEFKVWCSMRDRCRNPRNRYFKHYGGRGIAVCDEWNSYERFIADMGRRPSSKHSIDRINNDGGYNKANCRWATQREQSLNTRRKIVIDTPNGPMHAIEAAQKYGIHYATILSRLNRGKSGDELLTPPNRRNK